MQTTSLKNTWRRNEGHATHRFVHCTLDFTLAFNAVKASCQDHWVAALMLVQNINQPIDFPIWRRTFRLESLPAFMKGSGDLASQQAGFRTIATQASHATILTLAVIVLWITKENAFCFYTQLWKIHCKFYKVFQNIFRSYSVCKSISVLTWYKKKWPAVSQV